MDTVFNIRRQKLIIGIIVMLFAGVIYSWSILKAPFIIGDNYTQLGMTYTVALMFFCIGAVLSGVISKQSTSSLRLVLSAMLMFSSFFLSSYIITTLPETQNYMLLYMAYGVLGGTGMGIAYNTIISTMNMWYPDKRGLCSGLLITGFGLSVLLIGRLLDAMGNSEAFGWESTYVILAVTLGVVFIIAAIIIKPPPRGVSFPLPKKKADKKRQEEIKDYTTLQMVKKPVFLLIFVYTTILAATGSAAISFAGDLITDIGAKGDTVVTIIGVIGVFNGLGRLVSGFLFDFLGIKKTQLISCVFAIAAPCLVIIAITSGSVTIGIAGLCLCGLSFGFAPTTCSVFASEYFGTKHFPLNFGMLALILIPASFSSALTGSIRAQTGEFTLAFIIFAGLALVGFVVNLGIKKPR